MVLNCNDQDVILTITGEWVQDVESGRVGSVQFEIDVRWSNRDSGHRRGGRRLRSDAKGVKWAFQHRAKVLIRRGVRDGMENQVILYWMFSSRTMQRYTL